MNDFECLSPERDCDNGTIRVLVSKVKGSIVGLPNAKVYRNPTSEPLEDELNYHAGTKTYYRDFPHPNKAGGFVIVRCEFSESPLFVTKQPEIIPCK